MSMLDGFFSKGFKGPKCKTLLKLTIPRIKLLRNRREIQLRQMRRDIAKLLENGQEATARIRVEHIIREENMMAAQEIIELFCELISVRLPIIETQRECPLDLKEAISSLCFAAPRCSDLPELQQVQMLFAAKYGREFVAAATELMPDCGVNRQMIELLSVRAPSVEAKLKLLKEIAEEHEIDWDPAASETEFLKPHEDLLNGPSHFISGSPLPLPEEKHGDSLSSNPAKESDEEPDTDTGFDSLDLPEVPKVSVRTSSDVPPAPEIVPPRSASSQHQFEPDHEASKLTPSYKDAPHNHSVEPGLGHSGPSLTYADPNASVATGANKQFIPFVSSPPSPSVSFPAKHSEPPPSLPQNKSETDVDSPSLYSASSSAKQSEPAPSFSRARSEVNVDLQDVLAAAHAAAETAERAAMAARAAASLAQVRITELVTKRNNRTSDSSENEFRGEHSDQRVAVEEPTFDRQNSVDHIARAAGYGPAWGLDSPTLSSHHAPKTIVETPDYVETPPVHQDSLQPQRSTSLEDDPYFSYPNLFTPPDSNSKSGSHSITEDSRPRHEF